jgi:hypothetical protein
MHTFSIVRARAGITGLTAALAIFGLLSSPLGFHLAPRAMAESLTPAAPYPFTELDSVLIDEPGYKVGGDGFANGSPAEPAIVTWTAAWFGSSPELTGKIHFDGAERCARVTLISIDASGAEMTPRDYSDIECPGDLGHQAREITEGGNSGLNGRAGAAQVKVQLQTQNTNQSWSNAGFQTVTYGPVLDTDVVQIFRDRVDLGSGNLVGQNPDAPATLTWNSDGGPISATLLGTLFVKDSHDLCFRMHVGYKKHDGVLLEDPRHGDEHCVDTDALHTFPVNMGGAFADNELAEVTYAIEQKGGTGVWETVGQTTLELGDPGSILGPVDPTLP